MQPTAFVAAPASVLHPAIEAYASEQLDVGDGHLLYVEQCGNPQGMPLVYLHGGPGSGCSVRQRQFFDPALFRAVLFDQRGCGRSAPYGELRHNHTDALVQDLETLRIHLGIAQWLVVGGSWGAGLALAYASEYPGACLGLVLRGVFLGRQIDVDWFFGGAAQLMPDAWQQLEQDAVGNTGQAVLPALSAGLHGPDPARALVCALAWEAWEQSLSERHRIPPRTIAIDDAQSAMLLNKYRIQSHYLVHQCFREGFGLFSEKAKTWTLPTALLHGRLDWVCRPQLAWELHRQMPGSRLQWVNDCGHNPFETANAKTLVAAIQYFARHSNFSNWGTSAHEASDL
jgi:proline iminopeptidase